MKKLKNSNGALPKRRKSKKKIAIALLLLAGIAFGAKSYMGGNDKNIISANIDIVDLHIFRDDFQFLKDADDFSFY